MLKTVDLSGQFDNSLDKNRGCVMLLGGFDGLHAGHKKLVERAKDFALPIGIMTIVGGKEEKSLFTLKEREEIFKDAGVDFAFELPFKEIKNLSPEKFLNLLFKQFHPIAFVCGDDFRFGKNACGSAQMLKQAGQVRVEIEKLITANGEKISSTKIKTYASAGQMEKSNALLGEAFFLLGTIVKDRGVGRTLGFPTANVEYPKEKYPIKQGVYETRVFMDGKEYKAITNYGNRPTFDNDAIITETYIDGFSGELYGRELKIRFIRYLRDIKKFKDVKGLQAQLKEDIRRVREDD